MKAPTSILSRDGEALLYEKVFAEKACDFFFDTLLKTIYWQKKEVRIFGKLRQMPRLVAWYGDKGSVYTYSGLRSKPRLWTQELLAIKEEVERISGSHFNSVLLNLYRDGKDSMGWHKDNEKELGRNPVIASVSFGAERRFLFRHATTKELKKEVGLKSGSLLLMRAETQHHWYHSIPKTSKPIGARINLTFREIKQV
jgi:alkylated DNA repair dioxygenase AlkB